MVKLSANAQRWLKVVHLFFAALWVGGAASLTLMIFVLNGDTQLEIYGQNVAKLMVDYFIIIPGAMGCLVTGILYAIFTNWGWFKHKWLVGKWIITIFGILFGTFYLGVWLEDITLISKNSLEPLLEAKYMKNQNLLYTFGTFQFFTLVFAIYLSTIKPWRKKPKN